LIIIIRNNVEILENDGRLGFDWREEKEGRGRLSSEVANRRLTGYISTNL
jgi:hypothetical protein